MQLRALIFDLDGTLLDTLQDIGTSCNRVLAARGFPTHEIEAYRLLIGDGAPECVKRALPADSRSEALIQECLEAYFEEYERGWNVSTRPYDGSRRYWMTWQSEASAWRSFRTRPSPLQSAV